jgi:hypothetical protein
MKNWKVVNQVVTACPGDERLKIAIRPPPAASRQRPAGGWRWARLLA